MDAAEARRAASIMISNSIRWSLTGAEVLWTRKTSRPRTFSAISMRISPSENCPTSQRPTGAPRYSQISFTRPLLELSEKTTRSCSGSVMRPSTWKTATDPASRYGLLGARNRCGNCRSAAGQFALVLSENGLFHLLARVAVERVGDVFEGAVLAPLGGHGDEQSGIPVDDLQVAHHEAVI